MADQLLVPTELNGASDPFGVTASNLPYSVHCDPKLEGSEQGHIEFRGGQGNWIVLWRDGFKVALDATRTQQTLFEPGLYRFVKPHTPSREVGVYGTHENSD